MQLFSFADELIVGLLAYTYSWLFQILKFITRTYLGINFKPNALEITIFTIEIVLSLF